MTENEYKQKYYPQDFVLIGTEYYPLPVGGKMNIENKEIGTTFTTADGSIRKDTIKKYKAVSVQFKTLLQEGMDRLKKIVFEIENADFETRKNLYIKKENMPPTASANILQSFEKIKIDTVKPLKTDFTFRSNSMFVYGSINLKIN